MIAKQLQQALGADYTEIETVTPYPAYGGFNSKVVSQGQREVDEGFQPEIKPLSVNVADHRYADMVVHDGSCGADIPKFK